MRWPWQKREHALPAPAVATRPDAAARPVAGGGTVAVAVAPPPLLARRREWATLAPLEPASQPRLATAVHIAPAEVLAAPGSLVHRVEPAVTRADRPVGMWEDAAHVVGALAPLPTERAVSPSPPADVVLPALTYRQAPVVAPEPVRVIEPEPATAAAPVPTPPAAVAAPSVATTPVAPEQLALVLPAASGPSSSDEADDTEEQAAPVIRRPSLGQTRRLGLGPPIVRTPDPEPESVPDDVASALRSAYGVEVGDVVVRRDAAAAAEARDLGAAAFAREGQEVVVPIEVGPLDRPVGKGIVAHELTHIAQQRRHGPGLPAEDSPQGQALEAAARAAEQYFRGDAGAPRPAAPHAVAPDQVLTTGVAALDDAGEVVFVAPARPVAPVQRLTLAATTPPYVWQRIAAPVADDQAELDAATAVVLDEAGALGEPAEATVEIVAAQREQENLSELVQYRQRQREQYVADEQELRDLTRFGEPGPAPDIDTTALSADEAAIVTQRAELEHALRRRTEAVEIENEAVAEVSAALPLRDEGADPGAVPVAVDDEPEVVRLRGEIAGLEATYPELLHPALGGVERGPVFVPRDLFREAIPGMRSMPLLGEALTDVRLPATTTTPTTTPSGGSGRAAETTLGPSVEAPVVMAPPATGPSPTAAPVAAWEGGAFTAGLTDQGDFGDWLADGEPDLETLAADDARLQEEQRLPQIKAQRNALFRFLVTELVKEIRTEAQTAGRPVPSEYQATQQITRDEWQTLALAVEMQVPIRHLDPTEHALLDDPDNGHLRELVALSPESRDTTGTEPPGVATGRVAAPAAGFVSPTTGATIDLDLSMASAATFEDGDVTTSDDLGATADDGTFAGFVADLFSAASAPVDGDQGQTVPATATTASGAAPASAQAFAPARDTDGDGDVDADDEIAARDAARTAGANEPLELDEDVEISTELLMRLTSELYPRLRSRLRTELLIDRERAGLLTDLR